MTGLYWHPRNWPGRLAVAPRPRGGDWLEDEIGGWKRASVGLVVSLLTADEIAHFDLQDEDRLCRSNGIEFISFPVVDRGVPDSIEQVANLAAGLADRLRSGSNVVIHCRQGIGRSGLLAATTLMSLGVAAEDAMRQISEARQCQVPETTEQRKWVVGFEAHATKHVARGDSQT